MELKESQESASLLRMELKQLSFKMESETRKLGDELHEEEVELVKANRQVNNLQQKVRHLK